ncbi:unnamed protein product [Nesidiocoris tenuis]|uniref:Uncharacterized protein n=1 Tax=Nesidiocoris tenuis TaxID=355587 RepID=A0A6H5GVW5_9HEMI|nr:unnamed protein product [Nesidiocoris tenuis]
MANIGSTRLRHQNNQRIQHPFCLQTPSTTSPFTTTSTTTHQRLARHVLNRPRTSNNSRSRTHILPLGVRIPLVSQIESQSYPAADFRPTGSQSTPDPQTISPHNSLQDPRLSAGRRLHGHAGPIQRILPSDHRPATPKVSDVLLQRNLLFLESPPIRSRLSPPGVRAANKLGGQLASPTGPANNCLSGRLLTCPPVGTDPPSSYRPSNFDFEVPWLDPKCGIGMPNDHIVDVELHLVLQCHSGKWPKIPKATKIKKVAISTQRGGIRLCFETRPASGVITFVSLASGSSNVASRPS